MKKTLKTLSVVAFGSMIALSGASFAKAYNTNVQSQDVSTTVLTGDINTPTGLYIVEDQKVSILMGANKEYIAEMDVTISTYETADEKMSDGYDIDVNIDMPDAGDDYVIAGDSAAYTYVAGDQEKIGLVLSQGTDTAYSYQTFANVATTNDFSLSTDSATADNVMDLYKSNTSFRVSILNDPTATEDITSTTPSSSWTKENTRVAYTNTWYLSDLDSTISDEVAPYFDNLEVTLYSDLAGTTEVTTDAQVVEGMSISFDLYLNSVSADQLVDDSVTGAAVDIFGHILVPFYRTFNGVEYLYYYDVVVSSYSNIRNDATLVTEADANGENAVYTITLTDESNSANDDVIDLSTVNYREVDYYDAAVDGDGQDNLAYKNEGGASYYPGAVQNGASDLSENSTVITNDTTITSVDYANSLFLPTVQLLPHDENGNVYANDTTPGGAQANAFFASWYVVGNKADTLAGLKPAEPWSMGAGLITLIVIGSVALAGAIGFSGYWYSHKHHLKGKYDHHHLERLKHHVAKLEKTVAMDDKKAAEWDAKHHINHKDTKKKK